MNSTSRISKTSYSPRIVVKFKDFVKVPFKNEKGITNYLDKTGILKWSIIKKNYKDIRLNKLFNTVSETKIKSLSQKATEYDHTYDPVNLLSYFIVDCPSSNQAYELLEYFTKMEAVEFAYIQSLPVPPPINAADDPRSMNQGYLNAAPTGINARYAWTITGGDGTGTVNFIDVEYGWILNHEDIAGSGVTLLSGINSYYFDHGAAVLGEILMQDNTLGGVGITPKVKARVVSQIRPDMSYNTPDAILTAVANLSFGDVLLIEAQTSDTPLMPFRLFPVEIETATFDAIRLATALGITVVEAGCNGDTSSTPTGNNLDLFVNSAGKNVLNRTSADFKDSGAIIVGAASDSVPHTRLAFSNFGNRVDCYGWGSNVDTTGYSPSGATNSYTTTFGGTSSASPIIAGAAISVQSIADTSFFYRLSPLQMRTILSNSANGTPSANPATDHIGVMPDLKKIIDNVIAITPDVYIRDRVGDWGDKQSGELFRSPDIIVTSTQVANPQGTYGEGSGTENDDLLSETVGTGNNHFIYLRTRNRGGTNATNVIANVYWAESATLITPNLWNYIGQTIIPNIPNGNLLTVSNPIVWPKAELPPPGHYCFIALLDTAEDPMPDINLLLDWNTFFDFIGNNNNVAWRNFDIIPAPPPPPGPPFSEMSFMSPGAPEESVRMQLVSESFLPEGSKVFLEVPLLFLDLLKERSPFIKINKRKQTAVLPIRYTGRQLIGDILYPAGSIFNMKLLVSIPQKLRSRSYNISLKQIFKEKEVGSVTFRISPPIKKRKNNYEK